MSRDGKGNPGRIILKNQPRLRLTDVLRRRRSSLKSLLDERGISTYAALEIYCDRLGVTVPRREECHAAFPTSPNGLVNSPQEGVIVLNPPVVIGEATGMPLVEESIVADNLETMVFDEPTGAFKGRSKKLCPDKS